MGEPKRRGDDPDFTEDDIEAMEAAMDRADQASTGTVQDDDGDYPALTQDQIDALGANLVKSLQRDWEHHQRTTKQSGSEKG